MRHRDYVTDIEKRAAAAGISINELCRRVPIARSTFTRWKSGETEPQLRVLRLIDNELERAQKRRH